MTEQKLNNDTAPDNFGQINILLGKSKAGREWVVEHAVKGRLSLVRRKWKYIEPGPRIKLMVETNTEAGNDFLTQLYVISTDLGEKEYCY